MKETDSDTSLENKNKLPLWMTKAGKSVISTYLSYKPGEEAVHTSQVDSLSLVIYTWHTICEESG